MLVKDKLEHRLTDVKLWSETELWDAHVAREFARWRATIEVELYGALPVRTWWGRIVAWWTMVP